jgi:hypothetical protein
MTTSSLRWTLAPLLAVGVAGCVDKEIVKTPPVRSLTADQIVLGLSSPVFRDVLAARAQLAKLPDGDWLPTLSRLAKDPLPQRRMVALAELSRRPVPGARDVIVSLADDPDDAVRAEARVRLAAVPAAGGVP